MPDPDRALIAAEDVILDRAALASDLAAAASGGAPSRADAVPVLLAALTNGRAAIAEALTAHPRRAREAVRSYAWLRKHGYVTLSLGQKSVVSHLASWHWCH